MKFPATLTKLLAEQVAIPSVSPEGDAGGTAPGKLAVALVTLPHYSGCSGAEVRLNEVKPGRPNLVAHFDSRSRRAPGIAFVPHLDTVDVNGMTVRLFAPQFQSRALVF